MESTSRGLGPTLIQDYLASKATTNGESRGYDLSPELSGLISQNGYWNPAQGRDIYSIIQQSDPGWFNSQIGSYKNYGASGKSSLSGTGYDDTLSFQSEANQGGQFGDLWAPASLLATPFAVAGLGGGVGGAEGLGAVNSFDTGAMANILGGGADPVAALNSAAPGSLTKGVVGSGDAFFNQYVGPALSGGAATGGGSFMNADGTYGSTAANSMPGGSGTVTPAGVAETGYTPGFSDGLRSLMSGTTGLGSDWLGSLGKIFGGGDKGLSGLFGISPLGAGLNFATSLYGMTQADKQRKMALEMMNKASPWTSSGGADMSAQMLMSLMKDPSSITSMPGYKAGEQAITRSMAAQGYNGSGNMMAALRKFGGDFYDKAVAQLSGLAGTGFNPAGAASIGMSGVNNSAALNLAAMSNIAKTAEAVR